MPITLDPPATGDFSITLNTPAGSNGTYSLQMAPAADAHILRGYLNSLPGGAFTATVKVSGSLFANYNGMGLVFRDSAGKYVAGVVQHADGGRVAVGNWSDHTTQAADHALLSIGNSEVPTWLRATFTSSSSDIQFAYSYTGDNWINYGTLNTYLGTCDAFGIVASCWNGTTAPRVWFEHFAVA